MTRIVGSSFSGADARSQAERQVDEANRRNSWLRQMELALWSTLNENAAPQMSGKEPDGQRQSMSSRQPAAHASVSSLAHVARQSARMDGGLSAHEDDLRGDGARPSPQHCTVLELATPLSMDHVQRQRLATDADLSASTALISGAQRADVQREGETSVSQSTPQRLSSPPILLAPTGGRNRPDATQTSPDEPSQQESQPADAHADEVLNWQKRLMHVTRDGQDVAVWIRDSSLGSAQSSSMVYRLASEFADSGLRLKSATVNGRLKYHAEDVSSARHGSLGTSSLDPKTDSEYPTHSPARKDHGA